MHREEVKITLPRFPNGSVFKFEEIGLLFCSMYCSIVTYFIVVGIAQNHSNLFMTGRERIPGLSDGQVYTYPSKRWRKKRRQYLMQPQVQMRRCESAPSGELIGDLHTISTVENPAISAPSDDSKDSNNTVLKDDLSGKTSVGYFLSFIFI
jgi:hypothetical protein